MEFFLKLRLVWMGEKKYLNVKLISTQLVDDRSRSCVGVYDDKAI